MLNSVLRSGGKFLFRVGSSVSSGVLDNVVSGGSKLLTELLGAAFATRLIVYADSEMFPFVLFWLNEHGGGIHKGTVVRAKNYLGVRTIKDEQWMSTPDSGWRIFRWRGIQCAGRLFIHGDKDNQPASPYGAPGGSNNMAFIEVMIAGKTSGLDKAFIQDCAELFAKHYGHQVPVFSNQSNFWYFQDIVSGRDASNVLLPEGICEDLVQDVDRFIARRDWYRKMCIPYQRGYLLEGPPGGGKTSLITMIACHTKRPIYRVNTDTQMLQSFRDVLSSLPDNAILAIEDIDAAFGGTIRKEDMDYYSKKTPSLSSFLNGLDGINSTSGRILFMTTNHTHLLTPSLLRPGRADRVIHIGLATLDQMSRLFLRFHPGADAEAQKFAEAVGANRVAMATIQELMIQSHEKTPKAVVKMAKKWIEAKLKDRPESETDHQ